MDRPTQFTTNPTVSRTTSDPSNMAEDPFFTPVHSSEAPALSVTAPAPTTTPLTPSELWEDYTAKRAAWLEAVESMRPSFLAFYDISDQLDCGIQDMAEHNARLETHRAYISNLTASLISHQTTLRSSPQDDVLQLQVLAEIWQLTIAADTQIAMEKSMKTTSDSLGHLRAATEEVQKSAAPIRKLLESTVWLLKDVRDKMEEAGMNVPDGKEEVDLMNEFVNDNAWKVKPPSEKKTKGKKEKGPITDGLGKATAELLDNLQAITAAAPGTESLYRLLEGRLPGCPGE